MAKKKLNKIAIFSIVIIFVLVILNIILGFYFFSKAEIRNEKSFIHSAPVSKNSEIINSLKWYKNVNKERWQLTTIDNLKLDANYITSDSPSNKTVIVIHGFMGNKNDNGSIINFFHQEGYNVLAPDNRSHGDSQGTYIGYGWLDKDDYLQWINKVIEKNGTNQKILIWGVSMGGATTMMLSGQRTPKQVKAYIEDSGYSSVEEELSYQLKKMYHLPKWPLVPTASYISKIKAGYSYKEASSIEQLRKNRKPMLFIHGADDKFVPTRMVRKNFDATKGKKTLVVFPKAGHGMSYRSNPNKYKRILKQFLRQYFE